MKLALYSEPDNETILPAILTDAGLVDITSVVPPARTPQRTMETIIDSFDALRPSLEQLASTGTARGLDTVRLRPPLPRPSKVMCCIANYWEHAQREARPLNMFLKNPDAVVGPGDTIRLPNFTVPWMFMHEAELAVVLKGPARNVSQADWRSAVFGYTGMMDITGRGEGRSTWGRGTWIGKSFDTFLPIGPCITTADEIEDPNDLWVQFWNDGQLRHNYNTDDMEHRVPELDRVRFAHADASQRRHHLLRHQSRRSWPRSGRRDRRDADPRHRPHGPARGGPAEAQLGAWHLHGPGQRQP